MANTFQFKITQATTPRTPAVELFLKDLRKYPPLSKSEEYALFELYKAGDKDAGEKLIKHNLRFVVSAASRACSRSEDVADAVGYGTEGLIFALDRFDHTKGFKFISYAVFWINHKIFEGFLTCNPVKQRIMKGVDSKAVKMYEAGVSDYDIMETLGIGQKRLNRLKISKIKMSSVDVKIADSETDVSDLLHGHCAAPDDIEETPEEYSKLYAALDQLAPLDKDIVCMMYGIGTGVPVCVVDIAERLGFNHRQTVDNRIDKIKKKLNILLTKKNK